MINTTSFKPLPRAVVKWRKAPKKAKLGDNAVRALLS